MHRRSQATTRKRYSKGVCQNLERMCLLTNKSWSMLSFWPSYSMESPPSWRARHPKETLNHQQYHGSISYGEKLDWFQAVATKAITQIDNFGAYKIYLPWSKDNPHLKATLIIWKQNDFQWKQNILNRLDHRLCNRYSLVKKTKRISLKKFIVKRLVEQNIGPPTEEDRLTNWFFNLMLSMVVF